MYRNFFISLCLTLLMGSTVQATTPAEYQDIIEAVEQQNIEKALIN